jgi:indolepyruvate ferredoxin oxidoreductase beta subunit
MIRQRLLFTGVGGQGTVLASHLLGEAAAAEGIPVRIGEIHGVAQRGGIVEATVMLGGVESPLIAEGEADILVSFEPLEALRALSRCSARTTIITNTVPIIPFAEEPVQAEYPDVAVWVDFMKQTFLRVYAYDAQALAVKAGTAKAVNTVLLGTLIGADIVPISPSCVRQTIRRKVQTKFVDANMKAFDLGMQAII